MDVVTAPGDRTDRVRLAPLTVVEAMAAGRPIVAAAGGRIGDNLRHGKTGLLYPPGDARALAWTGGGALAPGSGFAIVTGGTDVRAGANPDAKAVGRLLPGAAVRLTGIGASGSYYVSYGGGSGWVAASALALPVLPAGSSTPPTTDDIVQIITEAADRFDHPVADMLRVASCESRLEPNAVNPTGSYGLFQFVPTTWISTPYAAYSIFDPWASANAAAWMWQNGRRAEWVCQ